MTPSMGFTGIFAVVVIFVWVMWMVLTAPVVYVRWTTMECVKVIPPEAGTCDALPKRYERVWVK